MYLCLLKVRHCITIMYIAEIPSSWLLKFAEMITYRSDYSLGQRKEITYQNILTEINIDI
jgi:hypothetical protein